jgi:hypothetical protein
LKCGLNMRRWFLLGLCSIASVGGACSSRSLLIIKVTSAETTSVNGSPDVRVTQNGNLQRHYPDPATITGGVPVLTLDENDDHAFGIYLPEGVSGDVDVDVTLTDSRLCKTWFGHGRTSVSPGSKSTVDVPVDSKEDTCPLAPVNDGGAVDSDAESDADGASPEAGEVAASQVDGGGDAACATDASTTPPVTCDDYCSAYATCADFDPNWRTCLAGCKTAAWPPGDDTMTSGNTIGCRLLFARMAEAPGLRAMYCPFASPDSNVCK